MIINGAKHLTGLVASIAPVQSGSGDASPTNVRPITGWSAINSYVRGKNLLAPKTQTAQTDAPNGFTLTADNGVYTLNGTATNASLAYNFDFPIFLSPGTYSISYFNDAVTAPGLSVYLFNSGGSVIVNHSLNSANKTATFTITDTAVKCRIRGKVASLSNVKLSPMVVPGDTAPTTFVPYVSGGDYTVSIPSTPGTVYGGTIDVVKGILTVTKANIASYNGETLPGAWISDRDVYSHGGTPTTGAQVVYDLATPVTYQLTPQQIETLTGYNYITADCGDVLSVSYSSNVDLRSRRRALMAQVGGSTPTVHGTWEDLFRTIDAGTYTSEYSVGEILPLDLGAQGVVNAKIVAFNTDNKSSSGKAPVTLVSQYLLATAKRFNPAINPASAPYDTGTGAIGGWGSSELRSYCIDTLLPLIPSNVRSRIVEVTKITKGYKTDGTANAWMSTTDKIWVPSMREIQNTQDGGSGTPYYGGNITGKQRYPNGTYAEWGTRTCNSETNRLTFNANGYSNGRAVTNAYQILIGFCIG